MSVLSPMIVNTIWDSGLVTFVQKPVDQSLRDMDMPFLVAPEVDDSRGVEVGDSHRQILVKYGIFKGGKPSDLVLQSGLEVPSIDIEAVRKSNKQNAVDILRVKGRVFFPWLAGLCRSAVAFLSFGGKVE